MTLLSIENVNYQYQNQTGALPTIAHISLSLAEKSTNVLIGPSGIGKTTLLNLIAGYLQPSSGVIKMHNQPVIGPSWQRCVVFQDMALYPWLNVRDNIIFGPKMRHQPYPDLTNLLEKSGLSDYADQYIYQLSGGLKQRVALARAFINHPPLLMMDESFGALDNYTRAEMQTLLFDLWEKTENSLLFITHDIDEALYLGQHIMVMNGQPGTIQATYSNPFFRHGPEQTYHNPAYLKLRNQLLDLIKGQN